MRSISRLNRFWFAASLAKRPASLVVDLGEVTFFDARGLSAVFQARRAAARDRCRLALRSSPPIVTRVIAAAGMQGLLTTWIDDETVGSCC